MLQLAEIQNDVRGQALFGKRVRPYLANMLEAIGLNVVYHRGEADHLYYQDGNGDEQPVLDMLGGYGVTLLGHNHPQLLETACQVLKHRRPFAAQASSRSYAGLLAGRLSDLLEERTGEQYVTTFSNSGSEAVEAAIKHAELEAAERIEMLLADIRRADRKTAELVRSGKATLADGLQAKVREITGTDVSNDINALQSAVAGLNRKNLLDRFCFLAVEGSFHGKTSGSLQLTYNEELRNPWQRIGVPVVFVPANDVAALKSAVASQRCTYYALVLDDDHTVRLEARLWTTISACFAEPIQGEGGIHELSIDYMQALREMADCECYPLIFDEIQSGMGRSGAFLASEPSGIAADYYLLSKALGGGLAKIGALMITERRYQPRFGYIHTSTFADDDFSAAIALRTLDILFEDEGKLILQMASKGACLLERLRNIQQRFPEVIADIRGRGLMIGIELADCDRAETMPLLRVLSQQNLLGFLLCGYLLHEESIRIAPALSSHRTIRLEPSALISHEDMDRFCEALASAAAAISNNDTHRLARFLVGRRGLLPAASPTVFADTSDTGLPKPKQHVAFLGHFVAAQDLLNWDPSLAPLSPAECDQLLERTQSILKPFLVNRHIVRSSAAGEVCIDILGIPYTAAQMMERVRAGKAEQVLEAIRQAVDTAKERGCSLMSFGGYTSIISANCTALESDDVALTSGNSLTAAAVIETLHESARERQIDLRNATLGVVGATGNIGKVLVEIEADHIGRLVLIGRRGSQRRLGRLADTIYTGVWQQVRTGNCHSGLATRIACSKAYEKVNQDDAQIDGARLRAAVEAQFGDQAPIKITTDMHHLRECDLIITATNAPEPLIHAEHIGPQPVVICDVAVPGDVSLEVQALGSDVDVIKGGVVKYPFDQNISIPGMTLPDGQAYACLTEAVLLGLDGIDTHFSYGRIDAEKVKKIAGIAGKHGFRIIAKEKMQDL